MAGKVVAAALRNVSPKNVDSYKARRNDICHSVKSAAGFLLVRLQIYTVYHGILYVRRK